jgi:ubiquinone/menaquinone biosynthesis C-methylase UbiE
VVVDLGSGPGLLTADLGRRLPSATVIGVEPNDQMLDIARAAPGVVNVRYAQGSAEHLPIPDATVDLVVSSLSAHHWDDLAAAVGEIGRVLRPDGQAWIYDLRFATFTEGELATVHGRLALTEESLRRSIPPGQGRLALLAVIGLTR